VNFFIILILAMVGLFVMFILFTMTPLKAWGGIVILAVIGIAAMFGYNYVKRWLGSHGL
jgi:drug/metabolite transporter (DMT)-like permease